MRSQRREIGEDRNNCQGERSHSLPPLSPSSFPRASCRAILTCFSCRFFRFSVLYPACILVVLYRRAFFVLNSVSLFLSVLICREFPPCCLPYLYRCVSLPCFPVALFRRVACRTFIVVFPCRTFIVVFPSRAFPPFCLSYFYRCVSRRALPPCFPAVPLCIRMPMPYLRGGRSQWR